MSIPARKPKPENRPPPRTVYLLNQVNQAIRNRIDAELRPHAVTGLQYTILTMVRSRRGISSADLSRRFFVTPQTMNEVVTGLEKRGLISREPRADNRRVLVIYLTDEGEALLVECDRVVDTIEAEAFGDMVPEEIEILRKILSDRIERQTGNQD